MADGVVYDPQEDRVTWPSGFQPRDRESGEERISEVELVWFTALTGTDATVPRRLLALLREHAPEAVPRRYGGVEPLPFRLEGLAADDQFVERWQKEATAWAPMLFWTATRPCFGGSAIMSTMQQVEPSDPGEPMTKVSMSFDGRVFARDPMFTERMVRLFVETSVSLGCLYAGAAVHRGVIVMRGRQSLDFRTEAGPFPEASRWMGLPAAPTWLAWFGRHYAELVGPALASFVEVEQDGGLFIRLAEDPADRDQLADRFPPLPLNLVATRRDKPPAWEPSTRYLSRGPSVARGQVHPRSRGGERELAARRRRRQTGQDGLRRRFGGQGRGVHPGADPGSAGLENAVQLIDRPPAVALRVPSRLPLLDGLARWHEDNHIRRLDAEELDDLHQDRPSHDVIDDDREPLIGIGPSGRCRHPIPQTQLAQRFVGGIRSHLRASGDDEAAKDIALEVDATLEPPGKQARDRSLSNGLRAGY